MNAQLIHPNRDALEAFGLGKLDENDADFVEQHLGECPACCETLLELQDDTFVELVRSRERRQADEATKGGRGAIPPELQDHPRYRVLKLLGRGGMGDVYLAEHRLMNRPVALKVMKPRLMRDARAVERFRREVQAAARLAHPHIVAAYDAEQAGDLHILAMEHVAGIDLAEHVRRHG
ncbi:MAG: protein kinase, partial [Planctomycetes bacterium]|nr:protein kinase [Planctomycetota bacterium]